MLGGRWIDRHATHGINHLQAVLMAAACAMTRSTSGRRRIWVRLRRCGQLLCHGLKLIPISPNSTATSSVSMIGRASIPPRETLTRSNRSLSRQPYRTI
jgi:hypothetical protein